MRINQFIARATGMSRRAADRAIEESRITVNGRQAVTGIDVSPTDRVELDGRAVEPPASTRTIMLNKPPGYVCSREGQGSPTIYELLPTGLRRLKPVGRLDKDSSGLLLMTDDGELANRLTHPRYAKEKVYEVRLDRTLSDKDADKITAGIELEDGISRLGLERPKDDGGEAGKRFIITMSEGRNRQIRRTFAALGYEVTGLHRTRFGPYSLGSLPPGRTARAFAPPPQMSDNE